MMAHKTYILAAIRRLDEFLVFCGSSFLCKCSPIPINQTTKTSTMAKKEKEPEPVKGIRIRFVGGSYKKEKGWLNDAMKHKNSDSRVHVIVKAGKKVEQDYR
jgi:hypothetical protein